MTTVAAYYKIDGEHIAESMNQAREELSSENGELVLDFSGVLRMDTAGLHAMENMAAVAEERSVTFTLRGVNVGVYKVLKLARLTSRFTFAS